MDQDSRLNEIQNKIRENRPRQLQIAATTTTTIAPCNGNAGHDDGPPH